MESSNEGFPEPWSSRAALLTVLTLGLACWLLTYALIVGAEGLWRLASHSLGAG